MPFSQFVGILAWISSRRTCVQHTCKRHATCVLHILFAFLALAQHACLHTPRMHAWLWRCYLPTCKKASLRECILCHDTAHAFETGAFRALRMYFVCLLHACGLHFGFVMVHAQNAYSMQRHTANTYALTNACCMLVVCPLYAVWIHVGTENCMPQMHIQTAPRLSVRVVCLCVHFVRMLHVCGRHPHTIPIQHANKRVRPAKMRKSNLKAAKVHATRKLKANARANKADAPQMHTK